MKKAKLIWFLCLLLVGLLAVSLPGVALADEGDAVDDTTIEEVGDTEDVEGATDNATDTSAADSEDSEEEEEVEIKEIVLLTPTYPSIEATAGSDFVFEVEMAFVGLTTRVFDLRVTAPSDWDVYLTPQYEKDKKITSISLQSSYSSTETVRVVATAPIWPLPEPGDYKITLEAVSETVSGSVEYTATVMPAPALMVIPTNGVYSTSAKGGKDNYYSINVQNLGTSADSNIKLSATSLPDGWSVTFTPDTLDSLAGFSEEVVEVNIQPPAKTVAGDYMIKLRASGAEDTSDEISVRVTVEASSVWGWVGVGIIIVVVIGLMFIFMRFSRR